MHNVGVRKDCPFAAPTVGWAQRVYYLPSILSSYCLLWWLPPWIMGDPKLYWEGKRYDCECAFLGSSVAESLLKFLMETEIRECSENHYYCDNWWLLWWQKGPWNWVTCVVFSTVLVINFNIVIKVCKLSLLRGF